MLVKIYRESTAKGGRYSPPACFGAKPGEIIGHAMPAGVVDRPWDVGDMLGVVEECEAKQPHAKVGRKPKAQTA